MPLRLTAKGKTLLAKVQSGKGNIQITKFATGDGVYEPEEDYSLQEELKSKKQEFFEKASVKMGTSEEGKTLMEQYNPKYW